MTAFAVSPTYDTYTYGMEPMVSMALVFSMTGLWFGCTILVLIRVNNSERRARKRDRHEGPGMADVSGDGRPQPPTPRQD